jgi:hypothetical protein
MKIVISDVDLDVHLRHNFIIEVNALCKSDQSAVSTRPLWVSQWQYSRL